MKTKFKVNDRVYLQGYGEGTIKSIEMSSFFPIKVEFDNNKGYSNRMEFKLDGSSCMNQLELVNLTHPHLNSSSFNKLVEILTKPKPTKKKVAIYIGRFAPLHNGHIETIKYCNNNYDKTIVLIGSGNKRRTLKNPFPVEMIRTWILENSALGTHVKCVNDYLYSDNKWIAQIEDYVYSFYSRDEYEFTIVGHEKDNTSYYLKIFPTWRVDLLPEFDNGISATYIRNNYFVNDDIFSVTKDVCIKNHVNEIVLNDLIKFRETEAFRDLMEEKAYFDKEDKKFEIYPYKDTLKFNCSDAVVVCDGNVLLIERKRAPGKGTWALPGGFVNKNETYEQCAIRELFEETSLKIPEKVLKGSLKRSKIFDNPRRNEGIPRITNAFYFEIQPDMKNGYPKLPKVKGTDDASNAMWVSLAEARHMVLFDDHADIIDYFVNSF